MERSAGREPSHVNCRSGKYKFFSGAIGSSVHGRGHARQDFQQLGQDLRAGNLTQAQSDFVALQKDYPGAQGNAAQVNGAQGSGSAAVSGAAEFQKLAQDLQAGNLTAAKSGFQALGTDAQQAFGRPGVHHHHHPGLGSGRGGQDVSQNIRQDIRQVLDQLGQAIQAGNISAARQSYGALTQDLQAFNSGTGTATRTPTGTGYWPVPGFLNLAA